MIGKMFSKLKKNFLEKSPTPDIEKAILKIDQEFDSDYEIVKIEHVGVVDPFAIQGAVLLKTNDGKEFPISAFSGEVARYISNFIEKNQVLVQLKEHIKIKSTSTGKFVLKSS